MLQLILLILGGAIIIGIVGFKMRVPFREIMKAVFIGFITLIMLGLAIKYFFIVLSIIGLMGIGLWLIHENYKYTIKTWVNEAASFSQPEMIEVQMIGMSQEFKNLDSNDGAYKFALTEIPYGRANAFLSYFKKSIDTEEVYYYSVYPSELSDEIREYGLLVTRHGIYIAKQFQDKKADKFVVKKLYIPFNALWRVTLNKDTLCLYYIDKSLKTTNTLFLKADQMDISLLFIKEICTYIINSGLPQLLCNKASLKAQEGLTPPVDDAMYYETSQHTLTHALEAQNITVSENGFKIKPIEVPRNQYISICALMQTHINGMELEGLESAETYIQESKYTYDEVKTMCQAGIIEGLVLAKDGGVYSEGSINALMTAALGKWETYKQEVERSGKPHRRYSDIENPIHAYHAICTNRVSITHMNDTRLRKMFQILKEEVLDLTMQCHLTIEEFNKIIDKTLYSSKRFKFLKDMSEAQDHRLFAKEAIVATVAAEVLSARPKMTYAILEFEDTSWKEL